MSNEIQVVNRHHIETGPQPRDVYIGRPSALGNIFTLEGRQTRESVIANFEKWLNWKIAEDDELVCNALERIGALAMDNTGQPVRLVCFCHPKPCHGDIIKKVIEAAISQHQEHSQ
ncbi:DUF4326 domain-containing protein [Caballeronia sp. TF1N1]|uniref:DUF4326 domain-containing protein n=1 Tax=Caballeronia sp. TF1N1 TaxID=2878153 RepID=UPI001FD2A244|nr:DUF4326 domain-containing protein [Caballeronia sp. TF1N1]